MAEKTKKSHSTLAQKDILALPAIASSPSDAKEDLVLSASTKTPTQGLERTVELPPDPAADNEPNLIRREDFHSTQIKISFINMTAGTSLREHPGIRVIQLAEKGITLEVPEKNCASGHHLTIELETKESGGVKIEFRATGKAEAVTHFPDHTDQVKIRFIQFAEAPWEAIQHLFNKRQKEIEQFIQSAGGKS